MNGAQFDPSLTSAAAALAQTGFTSPAPGFGGGKVGPVHFDSSTGALEFTPHNAMHGAIGGAPSPGTCTEGLMNAPECAALDPIFWLHHANIDRLWSVWIASGGGRSDPPDGSWLDAPFNFYTETGAPITMTAKEVLNTALQLKYVYA